MVLANWKDYAVSVAAGAAGGVFHAIKQHGKDPQVQIILQSCVLAYATWRYNLLGDHPSRGLAFGCAYLGAIVFMKQLLEEDQAVEQPGLISYGL